MEQLTFTNSRGESLTFRKSPPYLLQYFDGAGGQDADVQMIKSPYQDGRSYVDTLLQEKEMSVTVSLFGKDDKELFDRRAEISRVLNPKLGKGVLRYEYADDVREIQCAVDLAPVFPSGSDNRSKGYQRAEFTLIAPNPYWTTLQIESEPTFEPLFSFPFEGAFEMGLQRDARVINNDGDSPSPIQIDFYGPADNPRIDNLTTGEFIKVNRQLGENEVMRIDTTFGDISVVFDDGENMENVLNWIDLESTFFQLQVGENEIEYTADSDIQGARVDMFYRKYYVGV